MRFTNKQVQWASKHDWFMSGNKYGIVVRDYIDDKHLNPVKFISFEALYIWAGY